MVSRSFLFLHTIVCFSHSGAKLRLYKNHRIQSLPTERNAHVKDIVVFGTVIARTYMYLGQRLYKNHRIQSLPTERNAHVKDIVVFGTVIARTYMYLGQIHAYIEQHKLHANEVRLLRKLNQDPLAFVANQKMTPPHFNTYLSSYNNPQLQQQFSPSPYGSIHPNQHYSSTNPSQPQFNHSSVQSSYPYQSQMNHQTSSVPQTAYQSPQVSTQPTTELPLVDLGFAVPVFSPGDDPFACLNKAMAFLTFIASSRFPSTNHQLRTSSNLRNQATIQDGEGYMARQCSQLKRLGNVAWYKEKSMLAEDQEAGKILDIEDLDTYDLDCDDLLNAQAVLMANISNYGSDVISEVPHSETYLNGMENQSVLAMQDFEQPPAMDTTNNEIHIDSNIILHS
nr:hypothetical protein [Tanacetum cinerariifolium]